MINRTLNIGTRGSKMAIIQAKKVRSALHSLYPDLDIAMHIIETSGDWKPEHGETPLSEKEGGKGLFAKEIELALLDEKIDIGVHSVKDMPSYLPEGLSMLHYLKRETPHDAFISHQYTKFQDLPQGAVIGTTSVRRHGFLLNKRPDLNVTNIRGNVTTRIDKMLSGDFDALVLSASGLERIGETSYIKEIFSVDDMLPACGQGAIGIEFRELETDIRDLIAPLHDKDAGLSISAERGALRALNGSCRTPIGAYATLKDTSLSLTVSVLRPDGSKIWTESQTCAVHSDQQADQIGFSLGLKLKNIIDPDILV